MLLERSPVENQNVAEIERQLALQENDKPRDECGVFAMYAPDDFPTGAVAWEAGVSQEHRGHSGSGMAYIDPETNTTVLAKGRGRLHEAIREMMPVAGKTPADYVRALKIMVHNRYGTDPNASSKAAQPFIEDVSTEDELTLEQNGHLEKTGEKGINALAIKYGIDPKSAESDTHILTKIMTVALRDAKYRAGGMPLTTAKLGVEMSNVLAQVNGSYCLTMFYDGKVIGARDPWGVHPLSLGTFPGGKRGVFASETSTLETVEKIIPLESVRDVKSGELIVIDEVGIKSYRIPRRVLKEKRCKFEYKYTAKEESIVNGSHVRTARYNMGMHLAEVDPVEADMVIGVPSTGLPFAEGYSAVSGIQKVDAIIKTKDALRTFHLQGEARAEALKEKFEINADAIRDKSIIVIDDSTIKGNTARQLIQQLRDAGASEVHFRFASEPYISVCNLGMDTSNLSELIARRRSNKEIALALGADSVAFNTEQAIVESIDDARVDKTIESVVGKLCFACTSGDYGDGIVPEQVIEERRRLEVAAKAGQLATA